MVARVQVIVEAKDAASGVLRGITSQFGALGGVIEDITTANINWGNLAGSAIRLVGDAMRESIRATTEYAESVRDLSLISGQSTEETSRMLQVMDDFQLTAQDAETAVRTLTREGLAPTIDTLADLADQYVSLTDAQQKNELILKNLGRSGLQWANMLAQGGDAIRELSAGVDENLILTQENIRASEDYRLALDNWNDAVLGLKVSLGNQLLPVLADVLTGMTNFNDASLDLQKSTEYANMSLFERARAAIEGTDALNDQEEATDALRAATNALTPALEENVDAERAAAEAAKELSRANQAVLNNMFALQSASESFAEGEQERAARLAEIQAEQNRLVLQSNSLRAAGELTIDRQNELTARGIELEAEYQAVLAEGAQALEDKEAAGQRIIYNLLEQRAAADGLIDSGEVEFLQETAVTMGLVDRASADAAIQAAQTADAMWEGFTKVNQPMQTTADLMDRMWAYNGQTVSFGVAFSTNASGYQAFGGLGGYAEGGPVYGGQPIVVGEQGPEVFVPRANGDIIPNDQLSQPITININGTFRIPQDMDYVAQEVARRLQR